MDRIATASRRRRSSPSSNQSRRHSSPPPNPSILPNLSVVMETVAENQEQEDVSESSNRGSNNGKKTSLVWKTFESFWRKGVRMSRCVRCGIEYKPHRTSTMSKHVVYYCPFREKGGEGNGLAEFDQKIFREKLAEAIITHNLPFNFVEYERIRELFLYMNPKVKFVSRNTAKADVLKVYDSEKERLKRELESINGRVCLTSDIWTSINTTGYMAMTAHFVDNNWTLQSKLLVFRDLPPPHDGCKLMIMTAMTKM